MKNLKQWLGLCQTRDIEGYGGAYKISELGTVYSLKSNKQMKLTTRSDGYIAVILRKDNKNKSFLVHRLVARAFIKNPMDKKYINHKDANRANNCVKNLEWVTNSENVLHSLKINGPRVIPPRKDRRRVLGRRGNSYIYFDSAKEAALRIGVSRSAIANCLCGISSTSGGYAWSYAKNATR